MDSNVSQSRISDFAEESETPKAIEKFTMYFPFQKQNRVCCDMRLLLGSCWKKLIALLARRLFVVAGSKRASIPVKSVGRVVSVDCDQAQKAENISFFFAVLIRFMGTHSRLCAEKLLKLLPLSRIENCSGASLKFDEALKAVPEICTRCCRDIRNLCLDFSASLAKAFRSQIDH